MRIAFFILILSVNAFGNALIKDIERAARLAGVNPQLLIAVCFVESSWRNVAPRLDGDSQSFGVCQVKLDTARHMDTVYRHRIKANAKRLSIPFVNAFYAAKYLKFQLHRYTGDWQRAVDAYNKGHAVSKRSEYVRRVQLALNK